MQLHELARALERDRQHPQQREGEEGHVADQDQYWARARRRAPARRLPAHGPIIVLSRKRPQRYTLRMTANHDDHEIAERSAISRIGRT